MTRAGNGSLSLDVWLTQLVNEVAENFRVAETTCQS